MGFLNLVADVLISVAKEATGKSSGGGGSTHGLIDYGKQKKDDSHDHRYNTGSDRTPSQKKADRARQKD